MAGPPSPVPDFAGCRPIGGAATCHFCIVGCGYHAYTWPNKQGGTDPAQNIFKTDLSKQQSPETEAWYSPSMYNIVRQDG